ncbi:MAG: PEGA domain-containing protein, partial [Myxococcota bacterium]|nr:PEGA domain-containing protein [Myxococcota bacterium]
LDHLFRKVVTREDAIKVGLEIALSPATRHDTRVSVSGVAGQATMGPHFDETLGGAPALQEVRPRTGRCISLAVVGLLGLLGGLVWAVEPLPTRYTQFGSMDSVADQVTSLKEVAAKEVVLTVASDPAGAAVLQGGQEVGKTPFVKRSPRGAPSLELTFRHKGYEDVTRSYDFDKDGTFTVKLPRILPPTPPPVAKPKTQDKPDKNPYDFQPGRVKSTKDSPY